MSSPRHNHAHQPDQMEVETNEATLDKESFLLRAVKRIELNDLDDAEKDIHSALLIDIENSARAYELLAMIAEKRQDYKFAIKLAKTACQKEPATSTDAQMTLTTISMTEMSLANTATNPSLFATKHEKKRRMELEDEAQLSPVTCADRGEPDSKKQRTKR